MCVRIIIDVWVEGEVQGLGRVGWVKRVRVLSLRVNTTPGISRSGASVGCRSQWVGVTGDQRVKEDPVETRVWGRVGEKREL